MPMYKRNNLEIEIKSPLLSAKHSKKMSICSAIGDNNQNELGFSEKFQTMQTMRNHDSKVEGFNLLLQGETPDR